ncbi:MAG: winged helix-turn-helix domain-containing protein [Candidatus Moranbacteria bacterium]|nr:winged helix-turn-helix domain-containing protein [Candidatus Moranbacteria bacterium]
MLAKKRKVEKKQKTSRQMERHLKGVANHWRIEILFLVADNKGIGMDDIAEKLGGNLKTLSEHARRLTQAGLIKKHYRSQTVAHELTPYGKKFMKFLKSFSYS